MEFGDDNFPSWQDGDVKIVLGASRIHQVHSRVLRWAADIGRTEMDQDGLGKGLFSVFLTQDRAVDLSNKAIKRGVTTRYHIVATNLEQDGQGRFKLHLTPVPLSEEGQPLERIKPCLGLETGQRPAPVYDAFTAILESLYDHPLDLGGFHESIRDRFAFALHVINLSESLGTKYYIAPEIVQALKAPTSRGSSLYKIIARSPEHWLDFAQRIRSRELYKEALIHAVGKFQRPKKPAMAYEMTQKTYSIVERKAEKIKKLVNTLFQNILSYYPREMHRTVVTGYADTDNIGRSSYANDIFHWMALSVYRQYISQQAITAIDGEDMGYDLVSKISKGADNYCTMEDCRPFFQVFPVTAKAKDIMDRQIREIKNWVKPWATRLLQNNSEFKDGVGYFTCTVVEDEDYPFQEVDRKA